MSTTNPSIAPSLLTAKEVAAQLRVSERTLWRLLSAGRLIRPVRIGGSTRWRQSDVSDWIEQGCPDPDVVNN